MEIAQPETGAILDDKPIQIKGESYFEERIIPHNLFDDFAFVRAGSTWLLMGCVHGSFRADRRCLDRPGGSNAQVVASIFHPMDRYPRIRESFVAGFRNRKHQRIWKRFRKVEARIVKHMVPR
jgi:hypothetical protein